MYIYLVGARESKEDKPYCLSAQLQYACRRAEAKSFWDSAYHDVRHVILITLEEQMSQTKSWRSALERSGRSSDTQVVNDIGL